MKRIVVFFVNPSRRARFYRTNYFRQIHGFPQQKQNVDVVGRTTHLNGRTSVVVEYLRHIGVHLREMRFGDGFGSAFGREYQMYVDF